MSTEIAALPDKELNNILRNSLYPNASDMSLELVKGYCRASGLDIMLKPAHIVPMWNANLNRMVDVVMPGIGLYRIIAARTGEYAGISEPEFGATITHNFGGINFSFPEWCKVTVRRCCGNAIAEFTSKEYWLENYAVKGGKEKSIAPNSMWTKRPYAQIAKCAEAQALRKAFPEVGSQPTADEMDGKEMSVNEKIINPISSEPTLTVNEVLKKISASLNDDFSWIDAKSYTADEIKTFRSACSVRRKELECVVATQSKVNWTQLIEDAKSTEEVQAIYNGMSEEDQLKYNEAIDFKIDSFRN